MPSNFAINRLSAIDASGTNLVANVETDHEVAGSQGGLHLFDDKGHSADVSFSNPSKASNGDDIYAGSVPLSDARFANFNWKNTQATAFVDVKQNDGSMYRLWQGSSYDYDVNTTVQKQAVDRTEPTTLKALAQGTYALPLSASMASGKLTLNFNELQVSDDASGESEFSLSKISLAGNSFFGNAQTLQAVITPSMTSMVERGFTKGDDSQTIKKYTNLNESVKVTLSRQSDGSYTAQAPSGMGFLDAKGFGDFDAGDASLSVSNVQVAIVDPNSGKWDSNESKNYCVKIQ